MPIHPLVRLQRDSAVHAKNVQTGKERAHQHSGFTPEISVGAAPLPPPSQTSAWSSDVNYSHLGGHASGSGALCSSAGLTSLPLPPDAVQVGAFQVPAFVPSNADYEEYLNQRHNSPSLYGSVFEAQQSRIGDESFFLPPSSNQIVPSNATLDWTPQMQSNPSMPSWQGNPSAPLHPHSNRAASRSLSPELSSSSSSPSSYGFDFDFDFEPSESTPMSMSNSRFTGATGVAEDDPLLQLIADSSYLLPDFMLPGATSSATNSLSAASRTQTHLPFQQYSRQQHY